jgi:hypothetical protein
MAAMVGKLVGIIPPAQNATASANWQTLLGSVCCLAERWGARERFKLHAVQKQARRPPDKATVEPNRHRRDEPAFRKILIF